MTGMLNFLDDDPLLFRCYLLECAEDEVNTGCGFFLCMFVAHIGVRYSLDD